MSKNIPMILMQCEGCLRVMRVSAFTKPWVCRKCGGIFVLAEEDTSE